MSQDEIEQRILDAINTGGTAQVQSNLIDEGEYDLEGLNMTKNHLRMFGVLTEIDPLHMKHKSTLTPKEQELSAAYERRIERRKSGIVKRMKFTEIVRNKALFQPDEF